MKKSPIYKTLTMAFALSLSVGLTSCGEILDALLEDAPTETGTATSSNHSSLSLSDTLESPARTVMAVYMIGSDLEDGQGNPQRGGFGTSDLNEMVKGFNTLSADEQNNIDVFVGFGGANKPGWKGIRYADMACLAQDSQDGTFGNDTCYSYSETSVNLGDNSTLTHFIQTLNERIQPGDKTSLTFWDHGASYQGIGPDTNFPQDGVLTMPDFKASLSQAKQTYDMIGFDACLMGSIEVAHAVSPFANTMVASEELEPGHGWDYEDLVSFIGKNPKASPVAIGKKYVSSFIKSGKHKTPDSNIKTLSLVDLTQYQKVANALDVLANALNSNLADAYQPLLQAASRSEAYGVQNKGSVEMGVDLQHLTENIKTLQPQLSGEADALISALKSYVISSERDASKPNANGVSIFSPRYPVPIQNGTYTEDSAASRSWQGLSKNFVEKGLNDSKDPVIENEEVNCSDGFNCLTITDDVGVSEALSMNALVDPNNTDEFIITSTINMNIVSDKATNLYGLFQWDGTAEAICDGPCADDVSNGLGIPLNVENLTADGNFLSSADGFLNDTEVVYYFLADESGIIDMWAVPYLTDAKGNIIMNKEQLSIGLGDSLQFVNARVSTVTGDLTYDVSSKLTLSQAPVFKNLKLPGQGFYFAVASDLKGNSVVSEPHLVAE